MSFTTVTFIFVFFPISMALYYLVYFLESKNKFKNLKKFRILDLTVIAISSIFYIWAIFDDIFRFYAYIFIVYLFGKLIEILKQQDKHLVVYEGERNKRISLAVPILALGVIFLVYTLVHFKYTGILARLYNFFFKSDIVAKNYIAPLGISFITFSAISYLVDIYRGDAKAGSLIDCALYLIFFPKVVSGPIVLWKDFSNQIDERKISIDLMNRGITKIMIGFSKKLILADTFGGLIATANGSIDILTSWGVALLYMLQIYFDFSGYSDIVIGMSNMMGYSFFENFNFPYISLSITEFWRRWHISLGRWFREYIYFPLGGSRKGKKRTIINILIVFIITGVWHGAGWTYMLWGMINGICNAVERLVSEKNWYIKTPKFIKWLYAMSVTFFCWELFRFSDMTSFKNWIKIMFGVTTFDNIPYTWQYYFDRRIIFLTIIGIITSTVFGLPKIQNSYKKALEKKSLYIINQIIITAMFVISLLFMVNSNYSPFIYFQY